MPTYEITSPGGARYRITAPEGATQDDALKYVQQHQSELQALPATPPQSQPIDIPDSQRPAPQPAPDQPSRLERVGRELMQPVLGMEQLAGRVLPIPAYQNGQWVPRAQADDAAIQQNQARIQAARGGDKGINWEQMGLDVVNPVNYLPGAAAGRLGGVASKAAAPLAGAVSGLTQPVTDGKDFLQEKLKQAAGGAVGGKLAETGGQAAGKVIAPTLSGASKMLSDLGVRLTPGQMAGGAAKRAEDALSSVPVVGSFSRNAQYQSITDFNRAAINQGLKSIGVQMPANVPAGRDALNFMHDAISNAYGQVLPNMVGRIDKQFSSDLANIARLGQNLPLELRGQLMRILQDDVFTRFSQGGGITGQTAQEIGTRLDNLQNTMRISENPDVRRLGTAVQEIDASLDRMMDRTNPTLAPQKLAIDQAYAHYKTIERASSMVGANEGVFTPAQLVNSVKARDRSKDKSSFARGDALMQELAEAAKTVLPQKVNDSGTTERWLWSSLVGGSGFEDPRIAIGLAAASAPYTRPGMAAARWIMNPGPARSAAAGLAAGSGRYTAPAAAQIFDDAAGLGQ